MENLVHSYPADDDDEDEDENEHGYEDEDEDEYEDDDDDEDEDDDDSDAEHNIRVPDRCEVYSREQDQFKRIRKLMSLR